MITTDAEVRDRLGLGPQIPDETVTALRTAVEDAVLAVYPRADNGGGDAVEAVLGLCVAVWIAGRHSYDSGDGFTPQVTSNLLNRYGVLLAAYRDPGTMVG